MRTLRLALASALALAPAAALLAQDAPKPDAPKPDAPTDEQAKILEKKLHVPSGWNAEKKTVDLTYDFSDQNQKKDWKFEGFDRVIFADEIKEKAVGMELAAGSGVFGFATLDPVEFVGDYTIEVTAKQSYKQSAAMLAYLFGAKSSDSFAALYGDQFLKIKKSNQILTVTKNDCSADLFNGAREIKWKAVRTGLELEVFLNGDSKQKHKFGKKDLDGRVGFYAADQCRFLITSLHVTGVIAKVK
jgi:hypothetical protein